MAKQLPEDLLDRLSEIIDQLSDQADQSETRANRLQAEFSSFRRRSEIEKEESEKIGSDRMAVELAQLVDDCDRALNSLPDDSPEQLKDGLYQLRKTTVDRFVAAGYQPLAESGDDFDPLLHEALSVEPVRGPEGKIVTVFSLGWARSDGTVIKPAQVSVSQSDYVCPFGIPGCFGDCPGCTAEEVGE